MIYCCRVQNCLYYDGHIDMLFVRDASVCQILA